MTTAHICVIISCPKRFINRRKENIASLSLGKKIILSFHIKMFYIVFDGEERWREKTMLKDKMEGEVQIPLLWGLRKVYEKVHENIGLNIDFGKIDKNKGLRLWIFQWH